MLEAEKRVAHIHHKDGNPLNNPEDGGNWQVLCANCHSETCHDLPESGHRLTDGIYVSVYFEPWKREQILANAHNVCERCGIDVSAVKITSDFRFECEICARIITRRSDVVPRPNGNAVCRWCYSEYFY